MASGVGYAQSEAYPEALREATHLHGVLAGDDRDIDLYHWSSERFSAAWKTTISVLVAKGRARVGVAASVADWPKRIRDLQFLDHEGYAAAT